MVSGSEFMTRVSRLIIQAQGLVVHALRFQISGFRVSPGGIEPSLYSNKEEYLINKASSSFLYLPVASSDTVVLGG
jgi:hypothetical protein